ncbi:hypothetical protein SGLAM104S_09166 [Streptomyces glaucescens]
MRHQALGQGERQQAQAGDGERRHGTQLGASHLPVAPPTPGEQGHHTHPGRQRAPAGHPTADRSSLRHRGSARVRRAPRRRRAPLHLEPLPQREPGASALRTGPAPRVTTVATASPVAATAASRPSGTPPVRAAVLAERPASHEIRRSGTRTQQAGGGHSQPGCEPSARRTGRPDRCHWPREPGKPAVPAVPQADTGDDQVGKASPDLGRPTAGIDMRSLLQLAPQHGGQGAEVREARRLAGPRTSSAGSTVTPGRTPAVPFGGPPQRRAEAGTSARECMIGSLGGRATPRRIDR